MQRCSEPLSGADDRLAGSRTQLSPGAGARLGVIGLGVAGGCSGERRRRKREVERKGLKCGEEKEIRELSWRVRGSQEEAGPAGA